jgi:hypothetical protein
MKTSALVLVFVALAAAVEYSALKDVVARSTVHTLRLSEIEAKVDAQGPMDQVGALCYQQLREISEEVSQLESLHNRFTRNCLSTKNTYKSLINRLSLDVANNDKKSSKKSVEWNNLRPRIPPVRRRRESDLRKIKKFEKRVAKAITERTSQKKVYDTDMVDFAAALKDLDGIKKILENSNLGNKHQSKNTAKIGFLEAVDNVKSDRFRMMTNRLTRGALLLVGEDVEGEATGIDKLTKLLLTIRNELWSEMDKLTKIEARRISAHKQWLLTMRRRINGLHLRRARNYIKIGQILSFIGKLMVDEADYRIKSADATKRVDRTQISLDFLEESCGAEPPRYTKTRSIKMDEIKTINRMLKILRNLNWSGAVYSAIARISVGGVDENPEPGYDLGFQMDLTTGLFTNNYAIQNRDIKGFGRVAIHLKIGTQWVWASFDAWHQDTAQYLLPTKTNGRVADRRVKNLHVHKSPSANVETTGNAAEGNVEIWATKYNKKNAMKIPGASDGAFDFGDERLQKGEYGCFQVHDYLQKQTVLAVNNLFSKDKHDIGIGSQVQGKDLKSPDWTYANNFKGLKDRKLRMTLTWYFQKAGYNTKLKTTLSEKTGKSV